MEDHRPLLSDLLDEHSKQLSEMKTRLQDDPLYDAEKYDEVWMLRFLLTHKTVKKASAAAHKTMEFRKERQLNELGDIRHKMFNHEDPQSEHHFEITRKISQFFGAESYMHTLPEVDRGIINYITPKQIKMTEVVEGMTQDEVLLAYLMQSEAVYQALDEITRRTGRLTKVLRIMDMTDTPLKHMNRAYIKRDAAANKELEDFYPQLLGSVLVVNPPSWANALWKVLRPIFPKRFTEKLNMVSPTKSPGDVQYFLKFIAKEKLAKRYGGEEESWPPPAACKHFQKANS